MVAGGFNEEDAELLDKQKEFAKLLGKEIISQGHVLYNACLTSFDAAIAESANEEAKNLGKDPAKCIISYVHPSQKRMHNFGKIIQSQLQNWELGNPKLRIPEPIQFADAVILVGGYEGTHRAANWARIAKKPLLPITRFGGTSAEIYGEELDEFDNRYGSRVSRSDFENLAELDSPLEGFAKTVINLAELMRTSRSVFVIMSFTKEEPLLDDALDTFINVCEKFNYKCSRVDDGSIVPRILPEILKRISNCAFAIVDISVPSTNVYYELGYAQGQNKPVIITAKKGTALPFDVKDIPVIFWESQRVLREELSKKVEKIAEGQGH